MLTRVPIPLRGKEKIFEKKRVVKFNTPKTTLGVEAIINN